MVDQQPCTRLVKVSMQYSVFIHYVLAVVYIIAWQ